MKRFNDSVRRSVSALVAVLFALLVLSVLPAFAQTTAFTYQGRLTDSQATSSTYDLQFTLNSDSGAVIASLLTCNGATATNGVCEDVAATNGIFTVTLDFGAAFDGTTRNLGIGVRRGTEMGAFTALSPSQPITSAPYSIRARNADTADIATNATTATSFSGNLTGDVTGTQTATVVGAVGGQTAASVAAAAAAANQATDANTASAIVRRDGNGNFSAGTIDAATQFNIGGSRILGNPGNENLFAGVGAGAANTGDFNSFVGSNAGFRNTTGGSNSFFGRQAGRNNTTGGGNSFFGTEAGAGDFTGMRGGNNSFFGYRAGGNNGTGGNNTFVGVLAGFQNNSGNNNTIVGSNANTGGSNFLNFASAFGASARVEANDTIVIGKVAGNYLNPSSGVTESRPADTVRMPGSVVISGTLQLSGFAAGFIVPVANGGTGSQTRSFVDLTSSETIGGNKTFNGTVTANAVNSAGTLSANAVSSATGYSINSNRVLASPGSDNTFVGRSAGINNTTGARNSFVGAGAGANNLTGSNNTIVGSGAELLGSNGNLSYATVIGADARVSSNNTVVLGRAADTVQIPGNLVVTGSIAKGSGSFKIDHPLTPQNKYLSHSFVESPDMMNVYNGNITTNERGEATVTLPDYFESLNRDFRYQLTVIGTFAQAIVGEKVKGNQFVIRTNAPHVEVSWQVTGIRQDKFANDHRIPNAEDKTEAERGTCLYAPACGETLIKAAPAVPKP